MTQGCLLFAFNNERVDYVSQAQWSAPRIQRHLGLPTTLVTNVIPEDTSMFDQVIITAAGEGSLRKFDHLDQNSDAQWLNRGRHNAYAFSPYNETLVLDTDYVVSSNRLSTLFELGYDFLCHRDVFDVTNRNNFAEEHTFGSTRMPMYWATVMYFKRSELAKQIFDLMFMVEKNWDFYSKLYKFSNTMYRNDFALSIALATLYGHCLDDIPHIPWNLPTAYTDVFLNQMDSDQFQINYVRMVDSKEQHQRQTFGGLDLHVMNKPDFGKICGSRI